MADLELVGIHPDGDHLILIDPDGDRHRLTIDEALRAAVRRDRPHLEKVRSEVAPRPRQIQSMIRAGASAETVAAEAGLPVEQVRRYEGPVLAEREYVAGRARALHIGHSAGSPTLGEVVLDRLAARGVSEESLTWDARRQNTDPWHVVASFHAGDKDQEAAWEVDLTAGTFTALDDESRWLSETDLAGGSRHLSSVRGARLYDVETDADIAPALHAVDAVIRDSRPRIVPDIRPADPEADHDTPAGSAEHGDADSPAQEASTETLLAELNGSRGVRQRVEIDDEALAEQVLRDGEQQPTLWDEAPGAHPAASRPQDATDATILPGPGSAPDAVAEPASNDRSADSNGRDSTAGDDGTTRPGAKPSEASTGPDKRAGRRARRSRRTSVPSWDEIVFGAKND
ncbi:septation protein SepH [Pseudactinotalea sp. Z1732]|uniref:septation protein SepH n=1 Tax=Micrococcales TaxID=85006 RepID=UPI003C7BE382